MLPVSLLVDCRPDDPRLAAALSAAGLPAPTPAARYFMRDDADGFGAIEGDGPDRLLRSVVVPQARRGEGIGAALVTALADKARTSGTTRLWLLTTDAAGFFARLGWTAVDRASAPDAIRASDQFTTLCPASATLMMRELGR